MGGDHGENRITDPEIKLREILGNRDDVRRNGGTCIQMPPPTEVDKHRRENRS